MVHGPGFTAEQMAQAAAVLDGVYALRLLRHYPTAVIAARGHPMSLADVHALIRSAPTQPAPRREQIRRAIATLALSTGTTPSTVLAVYLGCRRRRIPDPDCLRLLLVTPTGEEVRAWTVDRVDRGALDTLLALRGWTLLDQMITLAGHPDRRPPR